MNLEKLYSDPSVPGSLGGLDKAYREFKKVIPNLTRKDVEGWMGWLEKRINVNPAERDYIEFALRQIRT